MQLTRGLVFGLVSLLPAFMAAHYLGSFLVVHLVMTGKIG